MPNIRRVLSKIGDFLPKFLYIRETILYTRKTVIKDIEWQHLAILNDFISNYP